MRIVSVYALVKRVEGWGRSVFEPRGRAGGGGGGIPIILSNKLPEIWSVNYQMSQLILGTHRRAY